MLSQKLTMTLKMKISIVVLFLSVAVCKGDVANCWKLTCPDLWEPLCASDGWTYGNKCELEIENCFLATETGIEIHVVHEGYCKKLYYNSNVDARAVRSVATPGCTTQVLNIHCTEDEFPICGSDGVSYLNSCKFCKGYYNLKAKGFDLKANHLGNCELNDICPITSKLGICPAIYSPVCASDGRTYGNLCNMCAAAFKSQETNKRSILTLVSRGICPK